MAEEQFSEVKEKLIQLAKRFGDPVPLGASLDAIERLEERLGCPIPPGLSAWLRVCNGSHVGTQRLIGIDDKDAPPPVGDMETIMRFEGWPQQWLPIAGDGCGNYYAVALAAKSFLRPVLFFDTTAGRQPTFVVASDLLHFLDSFIEDEASGEESRWPFDRSFVLSRDPKIAEVSDYRLPWNS